MTDIYFDNNATTPVDPSVRDAMLPFLGEMFGNPSSQHTKGVEAYRTVEDARHSVARALGVTVERVFFTSGATESINTALRGVAHKHRKQDRHIVTSLVEHDCVLETCRVLEESGCEVTYLAPDQYGTVTPEQVLGAIRDDTVCVVLMQVNNELGTVHDVARTMRAVKERRSDIVTVVDGAQAFGKIIVDCSHIDMYALSAHKIHGPKGVGALYVREGLQIDPLIVGGGQEKKMRSGTHNVPGIVGLGEATKVAYEDMEKHVAHITEVRDALRDGLMQIEGAHINSPEDALATTFNVSFSGVSAETLMHALEARGVYVSTGSACSTNNKIKSHVLVGVGADEGIQDSAIRFSFSRMNSSEEARQVASMVKEEVERFINVSKA